MLLHCHQGSHSRQPPPPQQSFGASVHRQRHSRPPPLPGFPVRCCCRSHCRWSHRSVCCKSCFDMGLSWACCPVEWCQLAKLTGQCSWMEADRSPPLLLQSLQPGCLPAYWAPKGPGRCWEAEAGVPQPQRPRLLHLRPPPLWRPPPLRRRPRCRLHLGGSCTCLPAWRGLRRRHRQSAAASL